MMMVGYCSDVQYLPNQMYVKKSCERGLWMWWVVWPFSFPSLHERSLQSFWCPNFCTYHLLCIMLCQKSKGHSCDTPYLALSNPSPDCYNSNSANKIEHTHSQSFFAWFVPHRGSKRAKPNTKPIFLSMVRTTCAWEQTTSCALHTVHLSWSGSYTPHGCKHTAFASHHA